jgi:enamine deaminase RidA (YjgF/YER057c/UK114 family)
MLQRHIVNPEIGFAEAVTTSGAGRTIQLSGNVGFDAQGAIASGGIEAEARQTFANLEATLERAGATLDDITKITAFIVDVEDYPGYAAVRGEVFADRLCASSTVVVAGLVVDARIEIEAVAFVGD